MIDRYGATAEEREESGTWVGVGVRHFLPINKESQITISIFTRQILQTYLASNDRLVSLPRQGHSLLFLHELLEE